MRLAAIAAAAILAGLPAFAQDRLTIVHVNDLDRMEGYGDSGGVARLATVISDVRAQGGTVLATSSGDSISPSLLSSFDEGAHMIALFSWLGWTRWHWAITSLTSGRMSRARGLQRPISPCCPTMPLSRTAH